MAQVHRAASRGLRRPLMRSTALVTAAAVLTSQTGVALAAPQGASVQAGAVSVSTPAPGHTRVDQATAHAIVNWDSFGIGRDESVRFAMPGAGSAILNRVTGSAPSHLLGRLTANGSVYLINRNGVVIGRDAVIDTQGFAASTLDMADQDFLAGRTDFLGDSTASVVNHGTIRAAGGDILLVGHAVSNDGTLSAPEGRVALGAGNDLRYVPGDGGGLQIRAGLAVGTATGVDTRGLIEAATAELKAAGGSVYDLAVNQEGVVRASGVRARDGRIILTADGGAIRNAGTLRATRGADGGEIFMGGGVQGGDPAIATAATADVTAAGVVDVSAASATGSGGTAVVWADEATAFSGAVRARGGSEAGDGGFAEISGGRLAFIPAEVDLTAAHGATGTLLLDPGDINIQRGASSNASQSGDTFTNATAGTDTVLDAATIEAALGGANVTVQSADQTSITLTADLAWAAGTALTLDSGRSITLNGSVSAPAGTLILQPSYDTTNVAGTITQGAGSTLALGTLRLKGDPANRAGNATFTGVLAVDTLDVDKNGRGLNSVTATNAANTIGTLTSTMSGLDVRDSAGGLALRVAEASAERGLDVRTVGDLTLLPGTSVGLSANPNPASVVLEAKDGAFINQAGATPFSLDTTQFQVLRVYASDLTRTNPGGIAATAVYGHDITSRAPAGPELLNTVSYIVYETGTAPTLVVVADDMSRVYGDANPTFTWSVNGLGDGESFADVVAGGTPALSTMATAASDVGTYAISTDGTGLSSSKYQLLFQNGTLTVTQAPVTLTVADNSRTYGSATLAQANSATASGLKNGHTVADLTLGWSYNQDLARGATNGGPTTPISATLGNANYTIASQSTGALTITKAPLSGTLGGAVSRQYGDTLVSQDLAANNVTWTGLRNGDTWGVIRAITTDDDAARSVGAYTLAMTGATADNYTITVNGTAALTVTQAPLTLTADDASRLFRQDNPAFTVSASNLKLGQSLGDIVDYTLATTATSGSAEGTYPITLTAALSGNPLAANYSLAGVNDGTLTVLENPDYVVQTLETTTTKTTLQNFNTGPQVITIKQSQPFTIKTNDNLPDLTRTTSIVVTTAPEAPAGDSEVMALRSADGQSALSDATKRLIDGWPKDQPMDAETKAYMDSIRAGGRDLDQVMKDAAAGDPAARTVMAAVMPALVSTLARKDPESLTIREAALLEKVRNRIAERRAALVATVRAKVAAHLAERRRDAQNMPLTTLFATQDFPDVLKDAIIEVNGKVIAQSAATIGGAAAAGAAAAGASIALASAIFPFAGSATIVSVASGSVIGHVAGTSAAAVAGAAAAPIALTVGLAAAIGAAGIIKLIESGENEAAYNAFVDYNSKPVGDLGDLAAGSDEARAELAFASSQIYMEMFGQ